MSDKTSVEGPLVVWTDNLTGVIPMMPRVLVWVCPKCGMGETDGVNRKCLCDLNNQAPAAPDAQQEVGRDGWLEREARQIGLSNPTGDT